jgi:hypothetical protein
MAIETFATSCLQASLTPPPTVAFPSPSTAVADSGAALRGAIGDEASVVAQLCASPGGLRSQPTQEQLDAFVRHAAQLDGDLIAVELTHQVVHASWQTRVRALAGVAALARRARSSGSASSLQSAAEALQSVPEVFAPSLTHANGAVRVAAQAAINALRKDGEPPVSQAAPASQSADLLGNVLVAPSEDGDANEAGKPVAPLVDLLGGSEVDVRPADVVQPDAGFAGYADDLLGGLASGAPGATTNGMTSEAADLFAGLSVSVAPPTLQGPADSLDDLWSLQVPTPAQPPPSPLSDALMSVTPDDAFKGTIDNGALRRH